MICEHCFDVTDSYESEMVLKCINKTEHFASPCIVPFNSKLPTIAIGPAVAVCNILN